MATTVIRKAMLKITADDGDTEAKLARISEQADELGRKHPELTARINTAAASAKLKVLKAELNDTGQQADDTGGRLKALGSAVNLFATGGLSGGIAEMSTFSKVMAGLNIATGLAEPLLAGAAVAAGGLAAGFVSAGIGLAAFGAVAKANYTVASTAATKVQAAQDAYNVAITHGTKQAAAYKAEQTAIAKAYAEMTPAQIGLSKSIGGAQNAWQSFVQSNTSGVAKVMTAGIGLLPKIFASVQPFMAPVEHALSGIVASLGKGLDSSGFRSFMSVMAANTGPMITDIAHAIGNVIVGLGGILKAFMPVTHQIFGGLDSITNKFAEWGTTLTSHNGFQSLMAMFRQDTPLAMNALRSLGGILKTVVSQMTGMSTFSNSRMLLQLVGPVLQFANALLKAHPELVWLVLYLKLGADGFGKLKTAMSGIKDGISGIRDVAGNVGKLRAGLKDSEAAASDATGAWGTFGGKISGLGSGIKTAVTGIRDWAVWSKIAGAATRVWTGIQAAFDVVMDANPVVLITIAVIALIAVIVLLAVKFRPVRDFFKAAWRDIVKWTVDAWHGIVAAFDAIVKAVSTAVSTVINFVKSHWRLIVEIFTGPIGLVVSFITGHWNQILSVTRRLVSDVTGFFRSLPGKIIGALGNVGSLLYSAGARIIGGLINGIKSMIGAAGGAIGSVVGEITSHLPFSPAKKGPLSGAGDPVISGGKIVTRLAAGMTGNTSAARAAAARIAQAAGIGGAGGMGGGGGGGGVIRLEWVGGQADADFMSWLKRNTRAAGGDPQMYSRKVAYSS